MNKPGKANFFIKLCIMWLLSILIVIICVCLYYNERLPLLCADIKTAFKDKTFFSPLYKYKIGAAAILYFLIFLLAIYAAKRPIKVKVQNHSSCKKPLYEVLGRKIINILLSIEIILFMVSAFLFLKPEMEHSISKAKGWPEDTCIDHALGGIDNHDYTNSLEAFTYNYARGVKTFEVDFSVTSDSQLVCWHSWTETQINSLYELNTVPTKEEFINAKILDQYTSLTPEDLFELMKEHEDIWIITDTKDTEPDAVQNDFRLILKAAEETDSMDVLNRLIVQLYTYEMYDAVEEIYSFPAYILTLYQIGGVDIHSFIKHCRFCKSHGIDYITVWDGWISPELMEIAKRYHIKIFVHTVNDLQRTQTLTSLGVSGFYTDFLLPEDFASIE